MGYSYGNFEREQTTIYPKGMTSLSIVWSLSFLVCIGYTFATPINSGYLYEQDNGIDPVRLVQALNERELASELEDFSMPHAQHHFREYILPKRSPFSAWGGKRSLEDDLKRQSRAQFSAWGGKRSD